MTVTVSSSSTGTSGGSIGATLSFTVAVGSGKDRYLLIAALKTGNSSPLIATVNGTPATLLGSRQVGTSSNNIVSLFGLPNPASGLRSVVISLGGSGSARFCAIAASLTGVDQTNPLGTFTSAGATSTSPSVSIPSAEDDMVLAFVARFSTESLTHGSNQTEIAEVHADTTNSQRLTATRKIGGTPSTSMSHTIGASTGWGFIGVSVKPAVAANPPVVVATNSVVAAGSGNTGWSARSLFANNNGLYVLAQDLGGSPRLRAYRSTDNSTTWAEQNAINAPLVTSGAYPHSSSVRGSSATIVTSRFTNTNTLRAIEFFPTTNTWAAQDLQNANATTDADNTSPIRVSANTTHTIVHYTSVADTADLSHARRTTGAWAVATDLAVNSAERSIYADVVNDTGFHQRFQYDVATDDFSVRSIINNGTTNGTLTDIDSTAATSEASHAPSTFEPYSVSGVTTVTAAFIDANDTINERECSLDVTSGSIGLGTARQLTASTAYAGGKLSTCRYNGDRYVFASRADGTSIDYWMFLSGSWVGTLNVANGSGLHLAQALPVEGVGILIAYNDGTDVKVGWAVDGPDDPEPEETAEFFYAQII